jgi:hypothetical protein
MLDEHPAQRRVKGKAAHEVDVGLLLRLRWGIPLSGHVAFFRGRVTHQLPGEGETLVRLVVSPQAIIDLMRSTDGSDNMGRSTARP